jgi:hypothetical protein
MVTMTASRMSHQNRKSRSLSRFLSIMSLMRSGCPEVGMLGRKGLLAASESGEV